MTNHNKKVEDGRSLASVFEIKMSLRMSMPSVILAFVVFVAIFIPFIILGSLFGLTIFEFPNFTEVSAGLQKPHILEWRPTWTAFIMCTLLSAVVGIHSFGMKRYMEIARRFTERFENNELFYTLMMSVSAKQAKGLNLTTYIGFLSGLTAAWILVIQPSAGWTDLFLTPRPWFAIVSILLVTLLARLIVISVIEYQNLRSTFSMIPLENLFVYNPLTILIPMALRRLLCWMILIAISALFFVRGEDIGVIGIPWVIIATLTAVYLFVLTNRIGRGLMDSHKDKELDDIRVRIEESKQRISDGDSSAAALLLVYFEMERRVEKLAETSLEFPNAMRALTYIFFPLLVFLIKALIESGVAVYLST